VLLTCSLPIYKKILAVALAAEAALAAGNAYPAQGAGPGNSACIPGPNIQACREIHEDPP
jgi:hypothetical protein